MKPGVNSTGSPGATLGPILCSLLQPLWMAVFPSSQRDAITCLCQVAIGITYMLTCLEWHCYMVWINK